MSTEAVVGRDMIPVLQFARCCQNCRHCISQTPCDDPTQYACGRTSRPEKDPPVVFGPGGADDRMKRTRIHLWWARHYVQAGTVCNKHEWNDSRARLIEYQDDTTRGRG